jgi:hypothetical protein
MNQKFVKGDLVIVPQKVMLIRRIGDGIDKIMINDRPCIAIYNRVVDGSTTYSEIIYNNELWTATTEELNLGENYVNKADRSL